MYFSIPDTSESSLETRVRFYHIHLNAVHHWTVRYSQFHQFHSDLRRIYPNVVDHLQPFPPKKLFQLSSNEVEQRRLMLERYLQSISQHSVLLTSTLFNDFFMKIQYETSLEQNLINDQVETAELNVYLLNQHDIQLENISPNDNTEQIYRLCANKFQIDQSLQNYFSLFFYQQKDSHLVLIRPLFSFESPFYSLKQLEKYFDHPVLVMRKSYWNLDDDMKLIESRSTRNLLFIQSIYDLEQTRFYLPEIIEEQFNRFPDQEAFKDYILLARQTKFYGYTLIPSCSILCPLDALNQQEHYLPCLLAIGNNELICYFQEDRNQFSFKVTRIRCWKVNWTQQQRNITFEYLFRRDSLQWITIHTEQAALVSTCLQSMVDEIMIKRDKITGHIVPTTHLTPKTLLQTRTQHDLDRLNNNTLFDKITGDDDL